MIKSDSESFEGLVYHLFPLGMTGASKTSRETYSMGKNIRSLTEWIPYWKELGVKAILLGPSMHSGSHGYDSIDLYHLDPRLGSDDDLAVFSEELHRHGLALIYDAVFNHTGRDFFAFHDLRKNREASAYRHWFSGVNFSIDNRMGDGFSYDCWDGHEALVKLNLSNPEVQQYLLGALERWINQYGFDGLRLDAADVIDPGFWPLLRSQADRIYAGRRNLDFNKGSFWLMGEMVFGDYSSICGYGLLDSITNYELYKGLYSSHNDANFFELAWSLQRQFAKEGLYSRLKLYTFIDNHDVSRIASILKDQRHLYPLHILLFTVPGIPSIYYGSEGGIEGEKGGDDWKLRPALHRQEIPMRYPHGDLLTTIKALSAIRGESPALKNGDYEQLLVDHRQIAFLRRHTEEEVIVAVNSSDEPVTITIPHPELSSGCAWEDLLNPRNQPVQPRCDAGGLSLELQPNWGAVLRKCPISG